MLQTLITVILPVFLVIGTGYGATRAGWISAPQIDGLMRFAQSFAIPCLLFRAIATLDLQASFDPRLLGSFYISALICFALGLWGARRLFHRSWEDATAIGFCCLFSNTVLLGLPITERAFGAQALTGNFAIIAFHSPFCYGIGITVMEVLRHRGKDLRQVVTAILRAMFRNALILAIGLGFVVNLSGVTLPEPVDQALQMLIRSALPVALFALGGVLLRYRPEGDLRTIAYICAVSLLIHPALVWSLGRLLDLPPDLFRSAVLTAAMAPGINVYIFANIYGTAKRVAASSVLIATAGSLFSVWMWITLLGI